MDESWRGRLELRSDRNAFETGVSKILELLERGDLQKVVLARTADCTLPTALDPGQLLAELVRRNPRGYAFSLHLGDDTELPQPRYLVGASPELLLQRSGRYVITNPLAGTIRRGKSAREDQELRTLLLASEKDRAEHRIVVDSIRDTLAPYCRSLSVPGTPSILETPNLFHLSSLIVGELADSAPTSLELALSLHPTPAVCGSPRERALDVLRELEGFERGYFAGLVGWCDAAGDGRWAIALRCGELVANRARLFAGAGIVRGSCPSLELQETEAKLEAMSSALAAATEQAMRRERATP